MEGASGVTRSILDELHSSDIQGDQMYGAGGLSPISSMIFILGISNEIKSKVEVLLLEVSSMNFILVRSKQIKWKVKVV